MVGSRCVTLFFCAWLAGCTDENEPAGTAGSGGSAGSVAIGGTTSTGGTGGSTGGSAGTSSTGGSAGAAGTSSCALTESGPVTAKADGEVIEKLRITSTSGTALEIDGFANVVVRDVEILHQGGPGLAFSNAPGLRVERVRVVHTGAPAKGANASDEAVNISGYASSGVVITHVKLEKGSSGVYFLETPGAKLSFVEGHDFRGPFPRGQLVQFDKSPGSLLEDFSCENPPNESWPEDNVSIYRSSNVTVRRGLIVGNNSPSGVGVMFELSDGTSQGGLAEDVDTVDMGNGSFSGYPARDVVFRRTRARDNHCTGQAGRDAPLSNALVWAGSPESQNLTIEDSKYFALCNPNNLVWDQSVFTKIETTKQDFAPREPIRVKLCWQ